MKIRQIVRNLNIDTLVYLLLVIGFFLGMVLAFVWNGVEGPMLKSWLDSTIMYLKYGQIQYFDLLFFVLKKRMGELLLLLLFCMTNKKQYFLLGIVALAGGFAGVYISEFIMCKGILGSVLFVISIFPHFLCYIYFYRWVLQLQKNSSENANVVNQFGQYYTNRTPINSNHFVRKIAPFAAVIMGILLECYVNPFFLKLFLKIFM